MPKHFISIILITIVLLVTSCTSLTSASPTPIGTQPTPTTILNIRITEEPIGFQTEFEPIIKETVAPIDLDTLFEEEIAAEVSFEQEVDAANIVINIDATGYTHEISPLIYGLPSGDANYLQDMNAQLNSWGGATSARYNWRLGNAWNLGKDGNYANTSLGYIGNDAAVDFVTAGKDADTKVYVTLPSLGWVAKDDNPFSCAFPANGRCSTGQAASCQSQNELPDPTKTSIPSNVEDIVEFVQHLTSRTGMFDILAIAHEPETWGTTHYDVNPDCMSYEDILNVYLEHANPIKQIAPDIELVGPSTCCWTFYWDSQVGPTDKEKHNGQDFLPWFLDQLKAHDDQNGQRHLDVLDIHYTRDFDNLGAQSARLRSVNSLWDRTYIDESEIREAVYLIPRMKELIAKHYPETKFGLGEWGFGGTNSVNGAIAIADSLGIFGREDIYYASHESSLSEGSPGYYGFKIFTNYNDVGGQFGDLSVPATSTHSDFVSSYAAIDSESGNLHIVMINKLNLFGTKEVTVNIDGFEPAAIMREFSYDGPSFQGVEDGITFDAVEIDMTNGRFTYELSSYSIYHLIMQPESR